jgi:uncharacterized surface protein with fasciclin (FAS1) repeats
MGSPIMKALPVVAAVTLGTLALPPGRASASPEQTLADILLSDSVGDDASGFDNRPNDFDIVTNAILLFPDLVAAAQEPSSDLTLFLPDDLAFRRLAREFTGEWIRGEADVFAVVASLGATTVRSVLDYHVVAGTIPLGDVLQADGAVVPTALQDASFIIDVRGDPVVDVRLIDNDGNDTDPVVTRPNVGGPAVNGRVHGLDRVLRPIDLP